MSVSLNVCCGCTNVVVNVELDGPVDEGLEVVRQRSLVITHRTGVVDDEDDVRFGSVELFEDVFLVVSINTFADEWDSCWVLSGDVVEDVEVTGVNTQIFRFVRHLDFDGLSSGQGCGQDGFLVEAELCTCCGTKFDFVDSDA